MAGRGRFVSSGTVRIDLSEGDWIDIKRELTYGEEQHLASTGLVSLKETDNGKGELGIDWGALNLAKIETWVIDWSFTNDDDKRMPVDKSTVRNLKADTAVEILTAIDKYEAATDELKNSPLPPRTEVEVIVKSSKPEPIKT